jgi:hypothetical protein
VTLKILYRSSSQAICCGADPHHVRAMAEALGGEFPASR